MDLASQRHEAVPPLRNTMRAQRFPLQLSVRYRLVGQLEWHRAQTENISASGVLVQAPDAPQVNTRLEFRLALPPRGVSNGRGEVSGRGTVVRQVMPPERHLHGFAV